MKTEEEKSFRVTKFLILQRVNHRLSVIYIFKALIDSKQQLSKRVLLISGLIYLMKFRNRDHIRISAQVAHND